MKGAFPLGDLPAGDTPLVEATGDPTLAHLTDPYASKIYLVEASPANSAGSETDIFLSSDKYATGAADTRRLSHGNWIRITFRR